MTSTGSRGSREERALHVYHDGELRRLARWRFERKLARSPELRRELEALERLRTELRGSEPAPPSPDLWGRIAPRLAVIDAERAAQPAVRVPLGAWLKPLGAAVAVAAGILAILVLPGDNAPGGVVRWMDSGGRSVLVLEDDEDVTVIWLLDAAPEHVSRGGFA